MRSCGVAVSEKMKTRPEAFNLTRASPAATAAQCQYKLTYRFFWINHRLFTNAYSIVSNISWQ
jgi:hypothetical protein